MRGTRRIGECALVLALVAMACGGSDGADTPESTATTQASSVSSLSSTTGSTSVTEDLDPETEALLASWLSDDPPAPVTLDYTVDPDAATSMLITVAGGSISATGADGTEYTLDVPADALISDELITMTPLLSADGVPTDVAVTGVLLEPEGLVFASPATLTISTADGADDLVAGTTFSGGSDFHLVPSGVVGDALVVEVHHFSVQTNMRGREQIADLRDRYEPTSGQARFEEAMAAALDLRRELTDGDREMTEGLFVGAFVRMFEEWKNDSVLPNLTAAVTDETRMDSAIAEAGTFLARIQTLYDNTEDGSSEEAAVEAMIEEVELAMGVAIEAAVDKAAQRCVENNDPDEAARIWRWGQIATRLDITWAIEGSLGARVSECLTFELDMTASFSADAVTSVATTDVVFDYLSGEDSVTGTPRAFATQGPISYDVFEVDGLGSGCETRTTNGRFEFELAIDMNVNYLDPGIDAITLTVRVLNDPTESIVCGETTVEFGMGGSGGFWLPHFRSATGTVGTTSEFVVLLSVVRDGDVFARLVASGDHPTIQGSTEDVSYELYHRPGE